MDILCDYHHDQLLDSLELLAKRLNANLYVMGGMEWFEEGFWQINDQQDTAFQFLRKSPNAKYVSLADAKDKKWDVVISTHINHFQVLRNWTRIFAPKAKFVAQVGNEWNWRHDNFNKVSNILNSTSSYFPSSFHQARYHPEFKVDYTPDKLDYVVSLTHLISEQAIDLGKRIGVEVQPIKFRMYGAGCPDGPARQFDVDEYVKRWMALYLYKVGGDGYGFSGHMALANGMPVISRFRDYHGKALGQLFVPDVNYCDIDKGFDHVVNFIKGWKDNLPELTMKARKFWENRVNFNWEFDNVVKPFFDDLV